MSKLVHKFNRTDNYRTQVQACKPDEPVTMAENLTYFWKNVTCKKCLKLKDKKINKVWQGGVVLSPRHGLGKKKK